MNPANPLESVYFIKLPPDFKFSTPNVQIDPSVLLPAQKKLADDPGNFNMKEITEEQILAGILTVLAYDKNNENLPYYRKLLEGARPNIKKELQEAAILKGRNEDWELAEEIWRGLQGLDPENPAIILNMAIFYDQRADAYRRDGLIDDADAYDDLSLRYYKDAMNVEPEMPDAFFNAAYFYMKKRNFLDARWCFDTFLALTSDTPDEKMGEMGLERKRIAQENLNKISARNLEDEHFHNAYELINRGEEEKGIVEIRKFLQDNPAVWNAWFMLGWGLRRLERFADAKQAFEKARECEGGDENADTLNELAICQMETGDLTGALQTLTEALEMDCDNTKIICNLGYLYLRMGNEAEARKFFMTALEISPDDKIALAALKSLEQEI